MDISDVVVRLALLGLPGILASKIYRLLRVKKKRKPWEDFIEIFLFAIFSYLILSLIMNCFGKNCATLLILEKKDSIIVWPEVLWACLISTILAVIASYLYTYSSILRIGRKIRATSKMSDEDIWFDWNIGKHPEWVTIRDYKTNLIYFGNIVSYSYPGQERELLLGNVTVFDNTTGKPCYNVEKLYLCRDKYDITIEESVIDESQTTDIQDNEDTSNG